jgi:hypothetical protein
VIASRLGRVADLLQRGVLVGRVRRREVGKSAQLGVEVVADGRLLVTQVPSALGQVGELLALLRRWRALAPPAGLVLLGPQLLGLGGQLAPAAV